MIRVGKPVQLMEWGEGTTTMNQKWEKIADGVLLNKPASLGTHICNWLSFKRPDSVNETTLTVEVNGPFEKKNKKEETIKIVQQSEGMTPGSHPNNWGEVAVGRLASVEQLNGKTRVCVEIKGATKIGH